MTCWVLEVEGHSAARLMCLFPCVTPGDLPTRPPPTWFPSQTSHPRAMMMSSSPPPDKLLSGPAWTRGGVNSKNRIPHHARYACKCIAACVSWWWRSLLCCFIHICILILSCSCGNTEILTNKIVYGRLRTLTLNFVTPNIPKKRFIPFHCKLFPAMRPLCT